jgi:hypothetical protein
MSPATFAASYSYSSTKSYKVNPRDRGTNKSHIENGQIPPQNSGKKYQYEFVIKSVDR